MTRPTSTGVHTRLSAREAAGCGMAVAVVAREQPERLAVATPHGDRSFDFLNARANQLVRALRARGLRPGDGVALVCANRPEFAVAVQACLRGGFRLTPVNWHLTPAEIAYVLEDCEARAVLADARFRCAVEGAVRRLPERPAGLAIEDPIHSFEDWERVLEEESPHDLDDPVLGQPMLYTSGTTGRPKGVYRRRPRSRPGTARLAQLLAYRPGDDLHLATGPLYHAAPLAFSLNMPLAAGCGVVMMDGWDAERALDLIQGWRVSHTHMVPIMFHHLLALPGSVRRRHDVSSLRAVLHGAAPCPVPVKQSMMEWLGPVLFEYYAATEGWACAAGPEEWLERPGTVGRPDPGTVEIRDDEGRPQPSGTPGKVYLRRPEEGAFEYYRDPEKTRRTYAGDFFTLGDVGYLDEDGFLFLCDRSSDVIISGGVNIYPAEVDAVLLEHPAVRDVATVGAPDAEWGERVVSVVEPALGVATGPSLREELLVHCRSHLAGFKCPRDITFEEQLPRSEAGKLQRRLVRERFWQGREARI